jgi:hypothetical protein
MGACEMVAGFVTDGVDVVTVAGDARGCGGGSRLSDMPLSPVLTGCAFHVDARDCCDSGTLQLSACIESDGSALAGAGTWTANDEYPPGFSSAARVLALGMSRAVLLSVSLDSTSNEASRITGAVECLRDSMRGGGVGEGGSSESLSSLAALAPTDRAAGFPN